jgi:transcriptional regulator with XRE-family HTH domain
MRTNGDSNGAVLFGKALTILRVSRGMSRTELAEAAEVGLPSLSQYERGYCRPKEPTLERILDALNLPPYAIDRAEQFARHPVEEGTLPIDDRAKQRQAAIGLAQECGRAVAHCCLAFMELQAGGWGDGE